MAYQSKYTGLQIDDILDSVEWKQGKIEDLASIRAGAQKGATALQSYTEKYTGTVTGIKINGVVKSGSGVIDLGTISTTETDPIFSASPAASITEAKKTEWDNKVDKVAGKQLSTEDFTTALKNKLEGLSNYDDTELSNAIETLRGDFDELVSGDTTTAIKTFNEVIAFLDGLKDTQDLESIIASIEQQIAGKMDTLISGTNIKTINGESILGSGDLTIESSGGSSYPVVELMDINGVSLDPNTYYKFTFDDGIFVSLTITLNESINNDIVNEYIFELNLPPSTWVIPIVSLPDTIKFVNNVYPEFEMGKTYIISIVNNYAVFAEFSNGDEIIGGGAA